MMPAPHIPIDVSEKRGLIVGIANQSSIAFGCARVLQQGGATLAITYQDERAEPYVRPLAEALGAPIIMPCNVLNECDIGYVFDAITEQWGKLDFLIHSIAYAPKADLHGRVSHCSREGFLKAMDVSCHSFLRMAQMAEICMNEGGSLLTVSYYGSEKVVKHYNMMGPVKAALESAVRYLSVELGEKNIRVNAISPGPIMTRAASGIDHFEELLTQSKEKSPLHHLIDLDDIGNLAAFLVSDLSKNITGGVHYVDCGYEVVD